MSKESFVPYCSTKEKRTLLAVAREVKSAIKKVEEETDTSIDFLAKRKVLREELWHHSPVLDYEVEVQGLIRENGDSIEWCVGLTHHNAPPIKELESALAPLLDKRFKHELSDMDIGIATSNYLKLQIS